MREFRLIFASHDASGLWRGDIAEAIGARLVKHFGGYTCSNAVGGYAMPSGDIIEEPVFVFDVAADMNPAECYAYATVAAAGIRAECSQESVYFRNVDSEVYLLSAKSVNPYYHKVA